MKKALCAVAAIGLTLALTGSAFSQYSGPGSGTGLGRDTGPGSGTGLGRYDTGPGSGTGLGRVRCRMVVERTWRHGERVEVRRRICR